MKQIAVIGAYATLIMPFSDISFATIENLLEIDATSQVCVIDELTDIFDSLDQDLAPFTHPLEDVFVAEIVYEDREENSFRPLACSRLWYRRARDGL